MAVVDSSHSGEPLRDAKRASHQSEERFRKLVESVKDYAIFMISPEGVIETWNEGAERTKGYKPHEIIGKNISTFYTPEDQKAGRPAHLLSLAEKNGRVEDEGWRVRKDGSRFWADVVITALRDDTGKLIGFAKVTRDLTERRMQEEQLRQSEERLRLLVENVRDYAIFMLDPKGRVMTWNAGAQKIKGYRADEIVGRHFSVFYPPEDVAAGKTDMELEVAAREGRFEDEGWRVRKDGSRLWANVVITALRNSNGELIGFSKVTRDLTERRNSEQERLRLAQAQEAVRLRDEFLSIASHELRTPLTALQLQLHGIKEKAARVDAALADKVEKARRSTDRLAMLTEALLDVARISTGRLALNLSEFEMGAAVKDVVERLSESAQRSGTEISLDAQAGVKGCWDPLRVEQIVSNLITNAIKYAAGAKVEISVRGDDKEACIVVRDHGPGIPMNALPRIFERFERGHSMRHFGGLGLGLYVAQQITEAHGGRIRAENAEGGGAKFTVNLPLKPTTPAPAAT